MADGFDIVAVAVAHKSPEVRRLVLRPQARRVQDFGLRRDGALVEGDDGGAIGSREGQMRDTWSIMSSASQAGVCIRQPRG